MAMLGAKIGSRAVPVVGWAALVLDGMIITGQALRRFDGTSGRLMGIEDAGVAHGEDAIKATAASRTLGHLESRNDILRMVGQRGAVGMQVSKLAANLKRLNLERAKGTDLIHRNPDFDSADSLVDKLIKKIRGKAEEAGLPALANEAAEISRYNLENGTIKTGAK